MKEIQLKYINKVEGIHFIALSNGVVTFESRLTRNNVNYIVDALYKKMDPDPDPLYKKIHFVRGCAKRLNYSCENNGIRYNRIFLESVLLAIAESNL